MSPLREDDAARPRGEAMSKRATKIQVALAPIDLARIAACQYEGQTLAALIRDALAFAAWVARQRADGWSLVAIRGTHTREMVP